jgi:RNA polymerase sigma-70 factor (ECF subfamily)
VSFFESNRSPEQCGAARAVRGGIASGGAVDPSAHARDVADASCEALARFVADGDPQAFRAVVAPHVAAMRAVARRAVGCPSTADDLVQEALIRAHRYLGEFRGEVGSLRAWLVRIVTRLALEPARWSRAERARDSGSEERLTTLVARPSEGPAAAATAREDRERIESAIADLPQNLRVALHLRVTEGLDYTEAAKAMGCSVGAARMRVHDARRRLLDRLGRGGVG